MRHQEDIVVALAGRAFDDAAAVKLATAMRAPTAKLKELRCSGHSISAVGAAARVAAEAGGEVDAEAELEEEDLAKVQLKLQPLMNLEQI